MRLKNPLDHTLPVWRAEDGAPIACVEKIKVMNENYRELQMLLRDFLEDGVLMGCGEEVLRSIVHDMACKVALGFGHLPGD